jgi:hypothetical protein
VVTSLLHHAVEGPVVDNRTSAFPTSCCCWRGAGGGLCRRGGRWQEAVGGGGGSWTRPAAGRVACRGGPAPVMAPFHVPGSSLFSLLPHDVAECCGHPRVDASHRLCSGFSQCGSFVTVCDVDCVLSMGGWLVLVRGGGACRARSVTTCTRGPPSSTSDSTSCLSCPVLPRRLWRVVGWVGILVDVIGWVESVLWEGCYPALTLTSTGVANRAS